MIGIYAIFRKSDNKCVYVGESIDVERRIYHHLIGNSRIHLDKDKYYGKIIEEHNVDDKQYRLERETFWINKLNAELNIVRDRHYYGRKAWNKGLTKEKDKRIKKISEKLKGKPSGMKGKHPSEETRKKLSENHADFSGKNNPMYGKHWKLIDGKRVYY